jgi:hypothetical protein
VTPDQLAAHVQIDRYGDFTLTDAIRPGPGLPVIPRQGYRTTVYHDPAKKLRIPVLVAAVSRLKLFDVFLGLLAPLGETVDVVLETSHHSEGTGHKDLHREQIDLPVLMSHFCDFEDLLLNDGCTGVAVISRSRRMEVQLDEHKLLIVYARELEGFQETLEEEGITRDDALRLITEGEHLHCSHARQAAAFDQLCFRVGIGEQAEQLSW